MYVKPIMKMNEVLTFDWGTNIVGILDVKTQIYIPYRSGKEMIKGAERIISSVGTIVSFNGNSRDLPELSKILGLSSMNELKIQGEHNDMLEITSDIRWPPDQGTGSILGPGLEKTYKYYVEDEFIALPSHLKDEYEESNWRDCYMTAELWKKWKLGELNP